MCVVCSFFLVWCFVLFSLYLGLLFQFFSLLPFRIVYVSAHLYSETNTNNRLSISITLFPLNVLCFFSFRLFFFYYLSKSSNLWLLYWSMKIEIFLNWYFSLSFLVVCWFSGFSYFFHTFPIYFFFAARLPCPQCDCY